MLLFTLAVSVATGLVFGIDAGVPGALSTPPPARATARARHSASHGVRSALIVVQVAASFMLLIGAGLTLRSLMKLQQVDPGFQTDNLLTMRIDLNFSKYRADAIAGVLAGARGQLRAEPGVLGVGGGGTFPLNDQNVFAGTLRDRRA